MHLFFRLLIHTLVSNPSTVTKSFQVDKGDQLIISPKPGIPLESCIVKMPSGDYLYSSKSLNDTHINEEIMR